MNRPLRFSATILITAACGLWPASVSEAREFDITDFGATGGDKSDDTLAIRRALAACAGAGGGEVFVPAGVFVVSRQGAETPILEIPSDTLLRGEGAASTLKFASKVNESNFWRMLGAPKPGASNIVIRDLRLDGSNTHEKYTAGETPEHNAGIWFYNRKHPIENVTIENCLVENFSGDCVAISYSCRAVTVRDVTLRNFLRQGIQMGGGNGARDYLVTGVRDLEHSVRPGGSTIHVEHARGLKNVIIAGNHCRKSILAGGVDGMIIRDNVISGRLVGNRNRNTLIESNVVRAGENASSVIQFGYGKNLVFRGNIVLGMHEKNVTGLYVWGNSRYDAQPGENVTIVGNQITAREKGILLNGTKNVKIADNHLLAPEPMKAIRSEGVESDLRSE